MFSEDFVGMSYMYIGSLTTLVLGYYIYNTVFGQRITRFVSNKINSIWIFVSGQLGFIWKLKEAFLALFPNKVKTSCIIIYKVVHYILKWLTGGIFACMLAFGRPLRDLKNLLGPHLKAYYSSRQRSTWNIITIVLSIGLVIAILWAHHIALSYLYEHGFAFAYALLILISKKITLLLLKTASKVLGFFFGEEIRENPNLRDWINESRASIASEYFWYLQQFDHDTQKVIITIYWPVQIWAWGTIMILGLGVTLN